MKQTIKLAQVGNSRGIRINRKLLEHYGIRDRLEMETTPDAIILRPIPEDTSKISWEATFRETAAVNEDWSDWETTAADGLDDED